LGSALERLKAKYGDKWRTDAAQFEYFADEVEGKIPGGTAVASWPQQRDLSHAGAISHAYEGYGDDSTETRVNNARKWLSAYREHFDRATTPTPAPPSGVTIAAHQPIGDPLMQLGDTLKRFVHVISQTTTPHVTANVAKIQVRGRGRS
jgi:hypothetical protein